MSRTKLYKLFVSQVNTKHCGGLMPVAHIMRSFVWDSLRSFLKPSVAETA